MNISFLEIKPERIEMYNFKNSEDQEKFFQLTETKKELSKCFQNNNKMEDQSNEWFNNLNKYFQQSFRKIRNCKSKKKVNKLDILLMKRTELVQKLKALNDESEEEIENEIDEIEMQISKLSAEENRNKFVENFSQLAGNEGGTSHAGVWAIHRRIFPKNCETLPFAKKNMEGKIISSQKELKDLYLDT